MRHIILHIDMNSYFASVEQQANPHLRGRPVGVCEHLGGIIIAPSVEAKRRGVKVAMPVWEAVKLCPRIILLRTDPDKYRATTDRFMSILGDYNDEVELYSIDEAFFGCPCFKARGCDSECYDNALLLALTIKQRIKKEVGEWISCSIGIGPNKLVAKVAADLGEGDLDRICVVKPKQIRHLYKTMSLTQIPGIGERMKRRLAKLGIFDLKSLADHPLGNLISQFGVNGYFLRQAANFQDSSAVVSEPDMPLSIGHVYTMPKASMSLSVLKRLAAKLAEKVGRRLRKHQGRAGLISCFYSDKRGYFFHRQRTLHEMIVSGADIFDYAWSIFEQGMPLKSGVKIMGVTVGRIDFSPHPEPILEQYKKPLRAILAADQVNNKYGEYTIFPGRLLGAESEWAKDTVGFGRTRGMARSDPGQSG
jgi:DNA polymerase-4